MVVLLVVEDWLVLLFEFELFELLFKLLLILLELFLLVYLGLFWKLLLEFVLGTNSSFGSSPPL